MQGANKKYDLIKQAFAHGLGELTEFQLRGYGTGYLHKNIMFVLGKHARGKTLNIWVYKGIPTNPIQEKHLEVFGVTDGQLGWSETYNWLITGAWKDYVNKYLEEIALDIKLKIEAINMEKWYADSLRIIEREQEIDDFEKCFKSIVNT